MVDLHPVSITFPFMDINDGYPLYYEEYDTGKMSTTGRFYFKNIPVKEDSITLQYFNQSLQLPP